MEKPNELTSEILNILKDTYNENTLHRLSALQVRTEAEGLKQYAETISSMITSIAVQPVSLRENMRRMAYHLCSNLWDGGSTIDDIQDALDDFQIQELRNKLRI